MFFLFQRTHNFCADYCLLIQELVRGQVRKFEFEMLSGESLRLDQELDAETYFGQLNNTMFAGSDLTKPNSDLSSDRI